MYCLNANRLLIMIVRDAMSEVLVLKNIRYVLAGLLIVFCTSCAHWPPTSARCSGSCTDDDITTSVLVKIAADPCLSDQFLLVDTNDRIVTLSGNVANPTQKRIVIEMAKSVPGVRYVISKLKIVPIKS